MISLRSSSLTLGEVEKSVEETLGLRGKKAGYWTKADQFRLEWEWVAKVKQQIIDEESP